MLNAASIHISVERFLAHTVQKLPNCTEEILFPALPAQFQVLYFPPIVFNQINLPIYSDEGLARQVNVLPQEQRPRWLNVILWGLIVIGAVALVYAFFEVVRRIAPV